MISLGRGRVASGLIAAGGNGLFVSLFLVWRTTGNAFVLSGSFNHFGGRFTRGSVRDAWQLHLLAASLLAVLAAGLSAAAFIDQRAVRWSAVIAAAAGLAFAAQAVTGALGIGGPMAPIGGGGALPARLFALARNGWSGDGEKLAIAALVVALCGLALGLASPVRRGPQSPALRAR